MSKRALLVLALTVLVLTALSLTKISVTGSENASSNIQSTSDPDEFIVGAYHIGCTDSNRLQELGLNMWQEMPERKVNGII